MVILTEKAKKILKSNKSEEEKRQFLFGICVKNH